MILDGLNLNEWHQYAEKLLGKDYFKDFFSGPLARPNHEPLHNVYYSPSEIIVLVNLPYVLDPSKIRLYVKESEVLIKGKISLGYEHMQAVETHIFEGEFEKRISLPAAVNTKRVNAQYARGILKIQLFPKLKKEGLPIKIRDR